jgi:muramoyltetrapeptide carboxypeptidase LdcA involved in peptidoglycan recycling
VLKNRNEREKGEKCFEQMKTKMKFDGLDGIIFASFYQYREMASYIWQR